MFISKNPIAREATLFLIGVYRSAFFQLLGVAMAFVAGIIIARALGPAARGNIAWLLCIVTLLGSVVQLGLGDASRKILSLEKKERYNDLFLLALLVPAALALLLSPFIYYFVVHSNKHLEVHGYLFIGLITYLSLFGSQLIFKGIAASTLRTSLITRPAALDRMAMIVAISVLVYFGALSTENAFFCYLFGTFTGVAYYIFSLRSYLTKWGSLRAAVKMVKAFTGLMFFSMAVKILITSYPALINLMLFSSRGPTELGYYTTVKVFFDNALLAVTICESFMVPKLLTMHEPNQRRKFALFVGGAALAIIGTACAAIFYFSYDIIMLVYGEKFLPSVELMKLLSGYALLLTITTLQSSYIYTHTDSWHLLISPVASLVCMLGAAWHMIPAYGATGAVYLNYVYAGSAMIFNFMVMALIFKKNAEAKPVGPGREGA